MALHSALRMEALHTEAPHEVLHEALHEAPHEAPRTEALHEALYTKALHDGSAYDGSVLFCLVGVEKPRTGHFCPYRLRYFMLAYSHYIQNHPTISSRASYSPETRRAYR